MISLFPPIGESAVAASPESPQVPGRPRPTHPLKLLCCQLPPRPRPLFLGGAGPAGGWGSWDELERACSDYWGSGIRRAGCESESACVGYSEKLCVLVCCVSVSVCLYARVCVSVAA